MCRNLRDTLPFTSPVPQLLHPSVQMRSRPLIATVQFPGQEMQDSRHAAPVWSEMMMSADQSPKATAARSMVQCPRAPSTGITKERLFLDIGSRNR